MEIDQQSSTKLSVYVACSNLVEIDKIKASLGYEKDLFIEEVISDGFLLEEKLKILSSDVLILDYHLKNINMLEFLEQATIRYPTTSIILFVDSEDLVDLTKLLQISIRNVISRPIEYIRLPEMIRSIFISTFKNQKLKTFDYNEKKSGALLAITSAKGGVGKSLFASNLSLILANLGEKYKVLLLDLGLPYGDIRAIMGIPPDKTQSVLDIITIADEITPARLESITVQSKYYPNIEVVLSPNKPGSGDNINQDSLRKLIRSLKLIYDFIIVDMNPGVDEVTKVVFERADKIFIMFSPEIHSIFRLVNYLKEFQWLKITAPPELIYNKRTRKSDQYVGNILSKVLPYPIYASISEDAVSVTQSLNLMYPVVTKKNLIRKDVMFITKKILEWYNSL
jgi:pilus assembly protein CpaE